MIQGDQPPSRPTSPGMGSRSPTRNGARRRPRRPSCSTKNGFIADADANWVALGVIDALLKAGHRVIAPDARGHGRSEKPHDPARYGEQRMARDLTGLFELIGAPRVDLIGYSIGAVVSLLFASERDRVRQLVLGGVGSGIMECGSVDRHPDPNEAIIAALTAQTHRSFPSRVRRHFVCSPTLCVATA